MFNFFKRNNKDSKLFYTTDIHSHLVPGVDDGSKNIESSIELITGLNQLGIERLIITPHVTLATFENNKETLSVPFSSLQKELRANNLNLEISHSAEYRVDSFFEKNVLECNDFMLMPNNYILIENSFLEQALNFEQIVFDLKTKGLKPILAHPERYLYYAQKKDRYTSLHNYEILFQCNILSFAGYYGKEVKQTAFWLLENNMVDFIGTDLHNINQLNMINHFIGTKDYSKLKNKANIMNDTAFI